MTTRIKLLASILLTITAGTLAAPPADRGGADPIPVFFKGARILFQGDSITDGGRGRNEDQNHILGHSYVFLIAAKYGEAFPELDMTFVNRGIGGNSLKDMAARWQKDTLDLKPDILSILIGINDNGRNIPIEQYEQMYDKLLTDVVAANPKVRLVLGEPFSLRIQQEQKSFEVWMAELKLRQEAVARLAKKHNAALVHYQKAFDDACMKAPANHWIWDGVHPTYSGHQLMADEWVRTVREFWPASPTTQNQGQPSGN